MDSDSDLEPNADTLLVAKDSDDVPRLTSWDWLDLFDDTKRLNPLDDDEASNFQSKWHRAFQKWTASEGLDYLAIEDLNKWPHSQLVFLVRELSKVLTRQRGSAVLRDALKTQNHPFVAIFLDACEPSVLSRMLKPQSRREFTILHQAIRLRSPYTAVIIGASSYDGETSVFRTQDKDRLTPLQLAIHLMTQVDEYEEFSKPDQDRKSDIDSVENSRPLQILPKFSFYDTVRHLIIKYPDALLIPNSESETPYRLRLRQLESTRIPDQRSSRSPVDDSVVSYIREYSIRNLSAEDIGKALYKPGGGMYFA
jgi:hypothetical protein